MRPFLDAAGPDRLVADLVARGWLVRGAGPGDPPDLLILTAAGRDARDAAFRRVDEVRTLSTEGISEAAYAALIGTLQRMAANLEVMTVPD
jgi:DNA-binding MarR family transcriptional regulator